MKKERFFWGFLFAAAISFVGLFTYFFMAVIFPYHVDQMKKRAVETVDHLQLVMPYLDANARQTYLENIAQKTEDLSYLLLMDVHGTALAHSNPRRVGMQFDEPGIRHSLASGERIEQVYVRDQDNPSSVYHGEKTIDIIEPLYLPDGTLAGAVNVGVSLAAVERIKKKYFFVAGFVSFIWFLFFSGFVLFQLRTLAMKRKADSALQESERRLSHAIAATSDAIWEYDLRIGRLSYSARWQEMFGGEPQEMNKPLEQWLVSCHPDDLERIRATIQEALTKHDKARYEVEFRIRHSEGHWSWMLGRGNVVEYDAAGQPILLSGTIVDLNERKHQEERLRESEARYRGIIDNMQDSYYRTDKEGRLIFSSPSLPRLLGYGGPEEMIRRSSESFWMHSEERAAMLDLIKKNGKVSDYEVLLRRKDGVPLYVATSSAYYHDHAGEILGVEGIIRDISERKSMQAQLNQAQKMEAVGRLAGGVAHDFNNILSVIMGRAELALLRIPQDHPLKEYLLEILNAAERSAQLTRHLLSFARKQPVEPKVIDLGEAVGAMLKMCQRLIGEDIDIQWHPAEQALFVKIDPTQLDQILTNLCVNARDAIAGVGRITIATGRAFLDRAFCARYGGLVPGEYASLSVSDTGCGMTKEVLEHVFEPFFTTKHIGQGTGLGLATVFGIAQQNQGVVEAESVPGRGSIFTLFLPLTLESTEDKSRGIALAQLQGHGETVLLVEDDAAIMTLASLMLEALHYTVLTASSAAAAMELVQQYPGAIHLLLTDVVMPQMNGRELAGHIQLLRPDIKCLYMSGYTADIINQRGILDKDVCLIHKPLTMQALALKVKEVLLLPAVKKGAE